MSTPLHPHHVSSGPRHLRESSCIGLQSNATGWRACRSCLLSLHAVSLLEGVVVPSSNCLQASSSVPGPQHSYHPTSCQQPAQNGRQLSRFVFSIVHLLHSRTRTKEKFHLFCLVFCEWIQVKEASLTPQRTHSGAHKSCKGLTFPWTLQLSFYLR